MLFKTCLGGSNTAFYPLVKCQVFHNSQGMTILLDLDDWLHYALTKEQEVQDLVNWGEILVANAVVVLLMLQITIRNS